MCAKRWYVWALVSLCLLLAARLVHGQSIEYTPSPPGSMPADSSQSWTELDAILAQLESEAQNLSDESQNLKTLLEALKLESARLSSELAKSQTVAKGLSISLDASEKSLRSFEGEVKALHIELWVWRGATATGLILAGILAFR